MSKDTQQIATKNSKFQGKEDRNRCSGGVWRRGWSVRPKHEVPCVLTHTHVHIRKLHKQWETGKDFE